MWETVKKKKKEKHSFASSNNMSSTQLWNSRYVPGIVLKALTSSILFQHNEVGIVFTLSSSRV